MVCPSSVHVTHHIHLYVDNEPHLTGGCALPRGCASWQLRFHHIWPHHHTEGQGRTRATTVLLDCRIKHKLIGQKVS